VLASRWTDANKQLSDFILVSVIIAYLELEELLASHHRDLKTGGIMAG
jgi:hypothetical protein